MTRNFIEYWNLWPEKIALLSIKPVFIQAILAGEKLYEFRRVKMKQDINIILFYASAPVQALVGFAEIEEIIENTPSVLWEIAGKEGGISNNDFKNYYNGNNKGYAIKFKSVYKFETPINPKTVWEKFYPPQSFIYINKSDLEKIIVSKTV